MRLVLALGVAVGVLVLPSGLLAGGVKGPPAVSSATELVVEVGMLGGVASQSCYRVGLAPVDNARRDVGAGGVVRQLLEARGRELSFLYGQLKRVYESAFIGAAGGAQLDGVASLVDASLKPVVVAQVELTIAEPARPGKLVFEAKARAADEFEMPPLAGCEVVALAAS